MESGIVTQMLRQPGPGGASVEAGGVDRVRPMTEPDLARVLELYRRAFPGRDAGGLRPVEKHLRDVLSGNPWRNETMPSLVYEDGAGRIAGCLGVMPRPMSFGGRPIQAAISHTFMVEPGSRSSLAALALARAFLSGGQDLSIAEGGGPSRRILERFGGSTSLLLSLRWTRPLRPGRYLLSLLKRRGLAAPLRWALAPLGAAADALAPAFLGRTARLAPPREAGEELTTGELLECMSRVCADRSLCPTYDSNALDWLLDLLAKGQGRGALQRVGVRDGLGEMVGWYIYYLNPGGISEVVQVGAGKMFVEEVLDHLFHHAWRGGALAVSGQLDPGIFQALAAKGSVFHHDGVSWFLIHSRDPAVLAAIHRHDAFLTRLEGEWCIGP